MNVKIVNEDQGPQGVIHMPDGMVGLPGLKSWHLAENNPPLPLMWFQSLDRPGFRVPVVDPGYFDRGFAFELDDHAEAELGSPAAEDLVVMIVTTVHEGGRKVTGNMAAPIVVNTKNWKGLQCILDERKYSLHQEIDYVRFGDDLTSEGESAATQTAVASEDAHQVVESADHNDPVLIES